MLQIEDIKKTFNPGTITEKKALSGITLHLAPGDFVTVIGGNGAGKSARARRSKIKIGSTPYLATLK